MKHDLAASLILDQIRWYARQTVRVGDMPGQDELERADNTSRAAAVSERRDALADLLLEIRPDLAAELRSALCPGVESPS